MCSGFECQLEECEDSIKELKEALTQKEIEATILRLQIDRCKS